MVASIDLFCEHVQSSRVPSLIHLKDVGNTQQMPTQQRT